MAKQEHPGRKFIHECADHQTTTCHYANQIRGTDGIRRGVWEGKTKSAYPGGYGRHRQEPDATSRGGGERVLWLEGNATAFGIYQALHEHRDLPVVIDDVDTLYTDRAAVRLLKCLCQTDPVKRVAWHTNAAGMSGIPRVVETQSKVCIIANEWKQLNTNVAAVQDRGHLVFFEPTPEEIHLEVAKWFWDQEVFDWFAQYLHLIPEPSMRHYVRAAELREAGIDWVKVMLSDTVPEKALLIAKLKADPRFAEERERVEAFRELGGGGQTTYYKWLGRIRSPIDTERLKIRLHRAQSGDQLQLRVVG